jgi:hypothetical protein
MNASVSLYEIKNNVKYNFKINLETWKFSTEIVIIKVKIN